MNEQPLFIPCEYCKGTGDIEENAITGADKQKEHPCKICRGIGFVSSRRLEKIKQGKQWWEIEALNER